MTDRLDIIVFGATGFTGEYTLPYIHKLANKERDILTWGIAGRSRQKLEHILNKTATRFGLPDLNSVPIIIADIEDEKSIKKMTAQAKVIVNCCGPYLLYGEVVVKACIETGTHHLDITAEPQFMEKMELKYNKAAEEKGIYIVSACGFGSVPTDLGVLFLEKHFQGTLNSIEIYLHGYEEGGIVSSPQFHNGTWTSAVEAIGTFREMFALRKKLYTNPMPEIYPELPLKLIRKVDDTENHKWALPLFGPLDDVVNRSQRYFYKNCRKRPIQVQSYILMNSFVYAIITIFLAVTFFILSQFKFGRYLLTQYPEIFSYGCFSQKDPSEDVLRRQHFSFTFYGKGWSKPLNEDRFNYKTLPNKTIIGRMCASNPAYGFTCLTFALCATIILKQSKQLPVRGGVYTPAVAFSRTSLIEDLQKNGVKLEILSNKQY